ncbi:MFS transporter [Ruania alba]|uniref:Predicted arabinose efflux permease, MFS family n=1 Tax=Ruania alba TaxID=648782 RepID=A0A1H5GZY9_9MICO|nr:MFS transporter [Ruania alba]SEE21303.1 Predicted arabinose efflux permease, MFS family [Ruania alba]
MTGNRRWRLWQRPWAPVATALTVIAWGGNQFTPLLLYYREASSLSLVAVNAILSVYVLGLTPALLLSGRATDRFGPRRVLVAAAATAVTGSVLMALGAIDPWFLLVGRFVTGLSVGAGMASATSWIAEISRDPFAPATGTRAGARRTTLALTIGFGVGPAVTAACVQWGPSPQVLPYLLHVAVTVLGLVVLRAAPHPSQSVRPARQAGRAPVAIDRSRFMRVVAPSAPWIFGANGISFAVVPVVVAEAVEPYSLAYSTLLVALTFAAGGAVQPLARRVDDPVRGYATLIALGMVAGGTAVAATAGMASSPALGIAAAVMLGSSYGLNLVSGLQEVDRIAPASHRGLIIGIFYTLSYSGFLLPAALAALAQWFSYPLMLGALVLLAMGCLAAVALSARRR